MKSVIAIAVFCTTSIAWGQANEYAEKKKRLLSEQSPFEKIVSRELPTELEYEDDLVVVFKPLRLQAPVHLLIVPKKRINTMNDVADADQQLLGHMMIVAKKMADQKGIAETGYRLSINTNEDAGQSVFHIHLHLLGGMKLGPMVDQTWSSKAEKN